MVVVSKGGQLVRIAASSISNYGRGTQGVRVVSLNDGDKVIAAAQTPQSGSETQTESDNPQE